MAHLSEARLIDGGQKMTLSISSGESYTLAVRSGTSGDGEGDVIKRWYRVFKNVQAAASSTSSRGSLLRLAPTRSSAAGVLSLVAVDHTVWSVSTEFVLGEWCLRGAADEHGLDQSMRLHPLRQLRLDVAELAPRMRSIAGFVRAAEHSLWVAVGDQWFVVDIGREADRSLTARPCRLSLTTDKIVHLCEVQRSIPSSSFSSSCASPSRTEVWTVDYAGKICIWEADHEASPVALPVLLTEGMDPDLPPSAGRVFCLTQASQHLLWAGTSEGRVMAFDLNTRQLAVSALQPLPDGHPLLHSRAVHALVSCHHTKPKTIWSTSGDRTLGRFQL